MSTCPRRQQQGTRQLPVSGKRRYVGQNKISISQENESVGRLETEFFLAWPNETILFKHKEKKREVTHVQPGL